MLKQNEPDFDVGPEEEQDSDQNLNQELDQYEEGNQSSEEESSYAEQSFYKENRELILSGVAIVITFAIFVISFLLINRSPKVTEPAQEKEAQEIVKPLIKEEVHYLGILPLQSPAVMINKFQEVENYLNENTDLKIELRLYPTSGELGGFTDVVRDVAEGKISFAYLASVTTVQANGNGPVVPFACAQKDGSPTYQGDLVVKVDSPYNSLEDLKGKKVSGTSKSSTSGNLMPLAWLKSINVDPDTYFEGGMIYLGSHDKAIEAVIKGVVDGAFINESTKNRFNKDGQVVKSIWQHDSVPEFPFVVNTEKVTPDELAEVKNALLKMHEDNLAGVQNVDPDYEKFVAINWEDYLGIKAAIDELYGQVFYDLENWGK